jgi:hypothetical protein
VKAGLAVERDNGHSEQQGCGDCTAELHRYSCAGNASAPWGIAWRPECNLGSTIPTSAA